MRKAEKGKNNKVYYIVSKAPSDIVSELNVTTLQ